MDSRIYAKHVEIDTQKECDFWNKQASNIDGINAVLLAQNSCDLEARREKQFKTINKFISNDTELKILEIGCGLGCFAQFLKPKIATYHGVDLASGFINFCKKRFENEQNIEFFQMSAIKMDRNKLLHEYDFVLMNGVLVHLNDSDVYNVFNEIKNFNPQKIYYKDPISIMDERLTLKDFYSEELKAQYSAIYRTQKEYETILNEIFQDYEIVSSELMRDEKTGARAETNSRYWALEKR